MVAFASSAADPFKMPESPLGVFGLWNPSGRTVIRRDAVLADNPAVFICAGDSLACNNATGLYTPTNSKIYNFNPYDGGFYTAVDPLLGGQGLSGCIFTRMADKLRTAGKYSAIVLVNIGMGGSLAADWSVGWPLNPRWQTVKNRLNVAGLTPTAVLWQLGANDAAAGVTQSSHAINLQSCINTVRAVRISAPFFVAYESYTGPSSTSNAAIRAAQLSVVNNTAGVFLGPDTDTIPATSRNGDAHFNATGNDAAATLWANTISAAL